VKNNQDNQIQSITLCNTYFSRKVHALYNGVWSKAGEFLIIFVLKQLLLTVSYRKNGEAGCTSCSPNNFVGEQSPGSCAYGYKTTDGQLG